MDRLETLGRILETGIVAVVRLPSSEGLLEVADAIGPAESSAIEFTMTTPGAIETLAPRGAAMGDERRPRGRDRPRRRDGARGDPRRRPVHRRPDALA